MKKQQTTSTLDTCATSTLGLVYGTLSRQLGVTLLMSPPPLDLTPSPKDLNLVGPGARFKVTAVSPFDAIEANLQGFGLTAVLNEGRNMTVLSLLAFGRGFLAKGCHEYESRDL